MPPAPGLFFGWNERKYKRDKREIKEQAAAAKKKAIIEKEGVTATEIAAAEAEYNAEMSKISADYIKEANELKIEEIGIDGQW